MKTILKTAQAGCAGLAFAALAACSGEPNAGDMKQAIQNNTKMMTQINMMLRAGSGFGGNTSQTAEELMKNADVEKGSCAPANGSPGFICDFRMNMQRNGQKQSGQWGKARFYNAGGWQIEQ